MFRVYFCELCDDVQLRGSGSIRGMQVMNLSFPKFLLEAQRCSNFN